MASGISTIVDLIFPSEISDFIVQLIGGILLDASDLEFVTQRYLPKLRQAFVDASVNPDIKTRVGLFFKLAGAGLKLVSTMIIKPQIMMMEQCKDSTSDDVFLLRKPAL